MIKRKVTTVVGKVPPSRKTYAASRDNNLSKISVGTSQTVTSSSLSSDMTPSPTQPNGERPKVVMTLQEMVENHNASSSTTNDDDDDDDTCDSPRRQPQSNDDTSGNTHQSPSVFLSPGAGNKIKYVSPKNRKSQKNGVSSDSSNGKKKKPSGGRGGEGSSSIGSAHSRASRGSIKSNQDGFVMISPNTVGGKPKLSMARKPSSSSSSSSSDSSSPAEEEEQARLLQPIQDLEEDEHDDGAGGEASSVKKNNNNRKVTKTKVINMSPAYRRKEPVQGGFAKVAPQQHTMGAAPFDSSSDSDSSSDIFDSSSSSSDSNSDSGSSASETSSQQPTSHVFSGAATSSRSVSSYASETSSQQPASQVFSAPQSSRSVSSFASSAQGSVVSQTAFSTASSKASAPGKAVKQRAKAQRVPSVKSVNTEASEMSTTSSVKEESEGNKQQRPMASKKRPMGRPPMSSQTSMNSEMSSTSKKSTASSKASKTKESKKQAIGRPPMSSQSSEKSEISVTSKKSTASSKASTKSETKSKSLAGTVSKKRWKSGLPTTSWQSSVNSETSSTPKPSAASSRAPSKAPSGSSRDSATRKNKLYADLSPVPVSLADAVRRKMAQRKSNSSDEDEEIELNDVPMPMKSFNSGKSAGSGLGSSYGSLSLGGDTSLSSMDSFNNSPTIPLPQKPKVHSPDLGAQPKRSILKNKPPPQPIQWKRKKYYSSDEESQSSSEGNESSSSSSEDEVEQGAANEEENSLASASSASTASQKFDGNGRLFSQQSFDTGDISISTYSDHEIEGSVKASSKKSVSSSSRGRNPKSAWTSSNESMDSSIQIEEKSSSVKLTAPRSIGSWSSQGDWSQPKPASDHWASQRGEWSAEDLAKWDSGDEEDSDDDVGYGGVKKNPANPKTQSDDRPRSAYDKDAPWYCGAEGLEYILPDDHSIISDSSSVLSCFKKKNRKDDMVSVLPGNVAPESEASLAFGDLLGSASPKQKSSRDNDISMSLGDLNSAPLGSDKPKMEKADTGSSLSNMFNRARASKAQESMSLGELLGGGLEQEKSEDKFPEEFMKSIKFPEISASESGESTDRSESGHSKSGHEPNDDRYNDESEEENTPQSESKDKPPSGDYSNPLLSPWFRKMLWVGLILFLIFDAVLLALLLTRKGGSSGKVLATVPATICWEWIPGQGKSTLCTVEETALGGGVPNLLATAILETSEEPADAAMIPAGLTTGDIPEGDFTTETARSVLGEARRLRGLTAEESLVSIRVTGAQIMDALEQSLQKALAEGEGQSYPYASGLRYSVDNRPEAAQRLVAPVISLNGVWGAVEPTREYSIITTFNWASGLFSIEGQGIKTTPLSALTDYAEQEGELASPEFSTREFVGEPPRVVDSSDPDIVISDPTSLATASENICLDWVPGQGLSKICPPEETAAQGGGVCNVVAWGLLTELKVIGHAPDIFILNAGECQNDIAKGPFEEEDAAALLPNNLQLVTLGMSGEQIISALEDAIDFVISSSANVASYPYAGGLKFSVDAAAAKGSRIKDVQWYTRERWKTINIAQIYRVGTTYPLAQGELGYNSLSTGIERFDLDLLLRDAFISHAGSARTLENPPADMYSTQQYTW